MTDLEELIQYWKDDLAINFVQRTPQTNHNIESTIKYLTELNDLHKIQRIDTTKPKLFLRSV